MASLGPRQSPQSSPSGAGSERVAWSWMPWCVHTCQSLSKACFQMTVAGQKAWKVNTSALCCVCVSRKTVLLSLVMDDGLQLLICSAFHKLLKWHMTYCVSHLRGVLRGVLGRCTFLFSFLPVSTFLHLKGQFNFQSVLFLLHESLSNVFVKVY